MTDNQIANTDYSVTFGKFIACITVQTEQILTESAKKQEMTLN